MPEFLTTPLIGAAKQFIYEHWTTVAVAILALMILGMLLGSLKRLTWRLFTSSLRAGEHTVNELFARPKGVLFAGAVAAIAAPSFIAGWRSAPERVVEKPVHVQVPDLGALAVKDSEIRELKALLESTKGDQSGVVGKAVELEGKLATAQADVAKLTDRVTVLANEKAGLEGQLAPLLRPTQDRLADIEGIKARIEEIKVALKAEEDARDESHSIDDQLRGIEKKRMDALRRTSHQRSFELRAEEADLEVRFREIEAELRRVSAKLPADKESKPNGK